MSAATSTETGIGRALRKARLRRGKSLEEASRDTRVKTEYLHALERERFDVLLGDVYVRGFLRSYSRYLGLNPEKVVGVYERAFGSVRPAPVHRAPGVAVESVVDVPESRRRTAWPLAVGAALIVLVSAGAIGLLSRSASTPDAAPPSAPPAAIPVLPQGVQVDLLAQVPGVGATVTVDGEVELNGVLDAGEGFSFDAQREIVVHLDSGGAGAVQLTVNGKVLHRVGLPGHPYDRTFTAEDFRSEGSPAG